MRDGSVTDLRRCAGCATALSGGDPRRRYCSGACRMRAHRARHSGAVSAPAPAPHQRADTVYECPECEERLLGERRCPECNLFCRSLGPGGLCPCCDEPVAIAELIGPAPDDISSRSVPV